METKVKALEMNFGTVAAKFEAGLASLVVMRRQQQGLALGLGSHEVILILLVEYSNNLHDHLS
jgi:hypothetical protein